MKIHTALVLLAAVTSSAAVGCGASDSASKDPNSGSTRVSLHRSKNCGDLLSDLKADATFKINKGIDLQIESIQKCIVRNGEQSCAYGGYGGGYGYPTNGGGPVLAGAEGGAKGSGAPAPTSSPSGSSSGSSGSSSPVDTSTSTSHSETNNQVAGVDEADFVKTDGKNLYVLHGRAFKVLNAWPANQMQELSTLDIEGTPTEMFVDGGKAVVYSQVNGASLYTATGIKPKDGYQDYAYAYGRGGVAVADAPSSAPYYPGGTAPEQYVPLTKITVLDLANGTPQVTREMYFEGNYLDSRRVGTHVRTVLSGNAHGPKLKYSVYDLYPTPTTNPSYPSGPDAPSPPPDLGGGTSSSGGSGTVTTNDPYPKTGSEMIAALQQLRAANKAAVDASQLSDWMPYTFTKNAGAVAVSSVACEDFYVPTTGSTESGLTEVASIDLANPTALARESAILGRAETVYGSSDTLYLAAQAWIEPPYAWSDDTSGGTTSGTTGSGTATPGTTTASPPPPAQAGGVGTKTVRPRTTPAGQPTAVLAFATSKTHIHKFDFTADAGFPNYVASGTVVGNVKNQFSLDDKDGYLRVATSESRMYIDLDGKYAQPTFPGDTSGPQDRPQTVNHVFTMGVSGGWLDLTGDVGELAPNEQIYSVRFIGGRGYVVTFRRTDPLFVIDLQNPTAPSKIAELTIPGFSEYMHPLDATHIMTIGRAASATGQTQGLQLQIFDVADGTNPILAHKFTYSNTQYGTSEAESNHKAFTYFADQGTLAFPYYAYAPNDGTGGGMHSSLELFRVDAASGFSKLGSIDHTAMTSPNPYGYCGGYYGPEVRRGVFLDNFVYSISYGGIIAKNVNDLAGVGSQLVLPSPQVNTGYGPACDGGGAVPPSQGGVGL